MNFGIYGLDIIYNAVHDHVSDIKEYRTKTLPLAQSLGLESFYTDSDMQLFFRYASSHSDLVQFIVDEYHRIDQFLISKRNYETAVLFITGGVLESMFFTGMSIEEKGLSDLKYNLLVNEKHLINQLVHIYKFFPENGKMQALKRELVKIQDDLNSFSSREELTEEIAKQLDDDIFVLREAIVANQL